MAWYGPKIDSNWKDLFAVDGELAAACLLISKLPASRTSSTVVLGSGTVTVATTGVAP
jgi:hypothetical protein